MTRLIDSSSHGSSSRVLTFLLRPQAPQPHIPLLDHHWLPCREVLLKLSPLKIHLLSAEPPAPPWLPRSLRGLLERLVCLLQLLVLPHLKLGKLPYLLKLLLLLLLFLVLHSRVQHDILPPDCRRMCPNPSQDASVTTRDLLSTLKEFKRMLSPMTFSAESNSSFISSVTL